MRLPPGPVIPRAIQRKHSRAEQTWLERAKPVRDPDFVQRGNPSLDGSNELTPHPRGAYATRVAGDPELHHGGDLTLEPTDSGEVLVSERQPLVRPCCASEVWPMDFVFDRTADGRGIKCLTIVDDATHESVVIETGARSRVMA